MTNTPFTPTQDKTRKTNGSPIDAQSDYGKLGTPLAGNQSNSGPRRTANIARVRESRTISDICADATFAAQTAGIKKWQLEQARERGRELTLKIAAMLQANVARLEVAEPVKASYPLRIEDRDEVVRAIRLRGYATNEEMLFLRETTTWVTNEPLSPKMQATKARVGMRKMKPVSLCVRGAIPG